MPSKIVLTNSTSIRDLEGILKLQTQNHFSNLSAKEAAEQGFVTAVHDLDLLTQMNSPYPHIIAKAGDEVVGYALVMTRDFSNALPVLTPMFDRINTLAYQGVQLKDAPYVVMGQVCISKNYRSMGIFRKLYQTMSDQLRSHFDYIITEIDAENFRSQAAHRGAGFETIEVYSTEKEWHIVLKSLL